MAQAKQHVDYIEAKNGKGKSLIEVPSAYLSGIPKGDGIASDGRITAELMTDDSHHPEIQQFSGHSTGRSDKSCHQIRKPSHKMREIAGGDSWPSSIHGFRKWSNTFYTAVPTL